MQLTSPSPASFEDLSSSSDSSSLSSLSIGHGAVVHVWYPGSREVSGPRQAIASARAFGAHMDVARLWAAQTRIERQEAGEVAGASFDGRALDAFQSYVSAALAFNIKRAGILYGRWVEGESSSEAAASASGEASVDRADETSPSSSAGGKPTAFVEAILEPPQRGTPDSVSIERGSETERHADRLAEAFGWSKVGWIFTFSSKEREYILSAEEACQVAAWQAELGDRAVTALVAPVEDEDTGVVESHVEAFQVSKQCVQLYKDGWFANEAPRDDAEETQGAAQSDASQESPAAAKAGGGPRNPLANKERKTVFSGATISGKRVEIDAASAGAFGTALEAAHDPAAAGGDGDAGLRLSGPKGPAKAAGAASSAASGGSTPSPTSLPANQRGVLLPKDPRDPGKRQPVMVAGKDASEIDTDYVLVPVPILDHEGPLASSFPAENRLLPRGRAELRAALNRSPATAPQGPLADFHLLLYLAEQPAFGIEEACRVAKTIREGGEPGEGDLFIAKAIAEQ